MRAAAELVKGAISWPSNVQTRESMVTTGS